MNTQANTIYIQFQFLLRGSFVKKPRHNFGYAYVFCLIPSQNNFETLDIHYIGLVLKYARLDSKSVKK